MLLSPARHFAVHFLKMIVAYIVLNYDIEHLDKRPDNMIWGSICLYHQVLLSESVEGRLIKSQLRCYSALKCGWVF